MTVVSEPPGDDFLRLLACLVLLSSRIGVGAEIRARQRRNCRRGMFAQLPLLFTNSANFPRGLEGARTLVNRGQTSEVQTRIEDIIAEDDKVAVRWTFFGHLPWGAQTRIPPTRR